MNNHQDTSDKQGSERRLSNVEYLPTKCRITKPPPPKPATNPLQFIRVSPCPLLQKAQQQIKKIEEVKTMRHDIKDDAEEWQQNLDNWKSSRRKRQEHIIERVVEVKKFEQEEQGHGRRKSKTFNEILEERGKRGHRFNIPIYDDDSNDLSDYGIGSNSSRANSVKDVDTDDSCSILDEKDAQSYKDAFSASNQSHSEDESYSKSSSTEQANKNYVINLTGTKERLPDPDPCPVSCSITSTYTSSYYANILNSTAPPAKNSVLDMNLNIDTEAEPEYTYEGAIRDYRSRIKARINIDESIFTRSDYKTKENTETQNVIPKIDVFKRKEVFELDKPIEISSYESSTSRRLSEDFANSQSIKDRLKSLEKCTDQPIRSVDKGSATSGSVKWKVKNLNMQTVDNNNQINGQDTKTCSSPPTKSISNYLLSANSDHSNVEAKSVTDKINKEDITDRCSSPEAEMYMCKLNMFNKDLDTFLGKTEIGLSDYQASTSSTELLAMSSDREDSGIHTADVSCSVSQADEPIEDPDLSSTTIPHCIERLNFEKEKEKCDMNDLAVLNGNVAHNDDFSNNNLQTKQSEHQSCDEAVKNLVCDIKSLTKKFIESEQETAELYTKLEKKTDNKVSKGKTEIKKKKSVVYENVDFSNAYASDNVISVITDNVLYPLGPAKAKEPPKEKPPPPPPPEEEIENANPKSTPDDTNLKRLNSTKRIKKDILIKRSNFLGIDQPSDEMIDPEIVLCKPPDINKFLQKECQLERSLYKKFQGSRDLSEVESQDSGLESDRGRLSSDTWCSSFGESTTPSHNREDSQQTNSVGSEEDEIAKREREIIELVEKEEKSKSDNTETTPAAYVANKSCVIADKFNSSAYVQSADIKNMLEDEDSEVLKVEQELLQLEREEQERQEENMLYRDNQKKLYRQTNRHSLENICDVSDMCHYNYQSKTGYRKSMPELQHNLNFTNGYEMHPYEMPRSTNSFVDTNEQYRKSMPDIQQAYLQSVPECRKSVPDVYNKLSQPSEYRKSMPELQRDLQVSAFTTPVRVNRQPILPGKPIMPPKEDKLSKIHDTVINGKASRLLGRAGIHALSAVPKPRHIQSDNWIQPKASSEIKEKSYNQHWLYQEAELRRLADHQANRMPWHKQWKEKHIPDPIIQTLTQRVHNRIMPGERNPASMRTNGSPNKEYNQHMIHRPHTVGHASPITYPPHNPLEESQGKMLSVSGKKKCSYCGSELGRGAAMIIESLCLFYHMDCFKCSVCHMQLGNGMMGTDVRVRNQKLHCHNCYSSDDGVKFSCV